MLIDCPYCRAQINGKLPKPGSYAPKCPKCGEAFRLVVPDDSDKTVLVSKRAVAAKPEVRAAVVGDPNATGAFAGGGHDATSPDATGAYLPKPAGEVTAEVTGAYQPGFGSNEATEATGGYLPKADIDATSAQESDPGSDLDATTDPAAAKAVAPKKKAKAQALPENLDGYELVKQLGAGGMGAVYLARQTSLDRSVALKVMHPQWADDPVFLARFTREAYAAAQLNHHNVVQVYDFGEDAGVNFFSMEFVEGQSLGDLVKKFGRLEPAAAVGHVLQAARGLKFAHDRGMIHRDIKPDNLMLNAEGLVKVADLGLVRTKGMTAADDKAPAVGPAGGTGGSKLQQSADVTTVGSAMGSPSYMSPEQCRDATTVDARSDIYSLGCTLYVLLSGRTPFQGKTAVEVLRQHLNAPPPPLATVAPGVPKELGAIVGKSLEKDAAARYQSMDELIAALKAWQDSAVGGPPRPTAEQVTVFEALTGQLTGHAPAKLGGRLAVGVPVLVSLVGLLLLAVKPALGGAVLLAGLASVPAGFVSAGLLTDSYAFRRARAWAFGWRVIDWLTATLAVAALVAALYFAGLLLPGLFGLVAGGLVGFAWAFAFARPVAAKRDELKGEFEKIVKRLRVSGVDEDQVREFAVNAGGSDWPAVYELLFGYEAMAARRTLDPTARLGLRDKLIAKFDTLIEERQQRRARKRLQAVERKRLEAEGKSASEAKALAADTADDAVEQGRVLRASVRDQSKAADARRLLTRYEKAQLNAPRRKRSLVKPLLGVVFDPRLRVVVGALLIVGGLMWASQNRAALAAAEATAGGATNVQSAAQAKEQAVGFLKLLSSAKTKPLEVGWLPAPVAGLFDSLNPVAAGLVLIASAFTSNGIAVLVAMLAAVATLFLHRVAPLPPVGPLQPPVLTLVGGLLVGLGAVLFLRRRG